MCALYLAVAVHQAAHGFGSRHRFRLGPTRLLRSGSLTHLRLLSGASVEQEIWLIVLEPLRVVGSYCFRIAHSFKPVPQSNIMYEGVTPLALLRPV
jgi:hypothetical protein